MRSSSLLTLVTSAALLAACGGDSNGPANVAPTAGFTSECTDLSCSFTDLSNDSDGSVASYGWDFGDGGTSGAPNPSHTFAAAGTYAVTHTAKDNDGDTGSITRQVTVTAPVVGGPAADFDVECAALDCTFTDQSTAGTSAIVTWAWEFGDGATSSAPNPAPHHYSATELTVLTIGLTVTDNNGFTSRKTRQITVSPPATFTCGTTPDCGLTLLADAVVTVTLESRGCTARNNTFIITAPALDTLFTDGCYSPPDGSLPASFPLNNGSAYTAGTEIRAAMISGSVKQIFAPAVRVTGAYPSWTVAFDDGERCALGATNCTEPDFDDLVLTITATPQ